MQHDPVARSPAAHARRNSADDRIPGSLVPIPGKPLAKTRRLGRRQGPWKTTRNGTQKEDGPSRRAPLIRFLETEQKRLLTKVITLSADCREKPGALDNSRLLRNSASASRYHATPGASDVPHGELSPERGLGMRGEMPRAGPIMTSDSLLYAGFHGNANR